MSSDHTLGQIQLADDQSASAILQSLLRDAANAFPKTFASAGLPEDPKSFRKVYPVILPRFEAARQASAQRLEIARHLMTGLQQHIVWHDDSGSRPLHEALDDPAEALPLNVHEFEGQPGWQPSLVYRGERWDTPRLAELGAQLANRGMITAEASEALDWVCKNALTDGSINLTGRKIALLGAGAEMAPTRLLLEAGADVLWLDMQPPPQDWWESKNMAGRLYWPENSVDLLTQPQAVLATLHAFADGAKIDLGLYAYAPGKARELRLTAAMNALVNAFPQDAIASVTMLVSPTTPTSLSKQDLAVLRARVESRPMWESLCAHTGLLGRGGGSVAVGEAHVTPTVVAIQGASYQAAQYLGKILMAECWSNHGQLGSANPKPLRVSANTAAITRTRSLSHPVFTAAFGGAAALGVETLAPRQSRRLNGLLAVHDWLHPTMPTPGAVRVHGGIHTLPYPLGSALRVAAVIGFARSPRLLLGLFSK